MNSLLLWAGALLAAALAALFAVPHFVDWNLYRGQFEAEASRMLGREVRVAGSVAVDILPAPRMSFGRVRIADLPLNPNDQPGEPILRADRIELGFGISGLLSGHLDVKTIEIVKPELRLNLAADGRGNWQTLALGRGSMATPPSELTVGNIKITGGQLAMTGPTGAELLSFTNVDGDLESAGGSGPLRFRGSMDWQGERRDLRVSTADAEPGALRLKAVLRSLVTGNTLSFDGSLTDLGKVPRIAGDLTAKVGVPKAIQTPDSASQSSGIAQQQSAATNFELRARVDGDGRGAKLDNVSFSFERDGQPQLVTGTVDVQWAEGIDVAAVLESRWLDFDRMAGGAGGVRPLDIAASLTRALDKLLPEKGRFKARVSVDQLSIGGEAASNVSLVIAGYDGRLTVDGLEAGLPGGGHLQLAGSASADASTFIGTTRLRANSAARLLSWAAKETPFSTIESDGAFIIDAAIRSTDDELVVERIEAEIAGQTLRGSLRHRYGQRPVTTIVIEGQSLDISGLFPGMLDIGRVTSLLTGQKGEGLQNSTAARWLDPANRDFAIKLKTGRISDGVTRLGDVDVDFDVAASGTTIRKLKYVAGDDLAVDVNGELLSPSGQGDRKGMVAWHVGARTAAAVRRLATTVGIGDGHPVAAAMYAASTPLQLAGSFSLSAARGAPVEWQVDGVARTTRMRLTAKSTRDVDQWRTAPFEAEIDIDGPEALAIVGIAPARRNEAATPPAKVSVRVSGVPNDGVIAKITAQTITAGSPQELRYDGRIAMPITGPESTGRLTVNLSDGATLLRLARLPFATPFNDVPVQGTIGIAQNKDGLTLALDRVRIAGANVSGAVLRSEQGKLDASLVAERLSVRDLLAALTVPVTQPSVASSSPDQGPWPDTPFDLSLMGRTEANINLATSRLEIDSGAALQDARIELSFAPGRLEVTTLAASMLEGRLTSSWSLTAGQAEATLAGSLDLTDADLSAISLGRLSAKGFASANLTLSGRGLSPRSLLQFATGKGAVQLRDAALPGLNPAAVQRAAQSFLATNAPPADGQLQNLVRTALAQGELKLATQTVPIEMSSGAVKFGPLKAEATEATITNRTTIDLATFKADSDWRLVPKSLDLGTKRKDALPPVTLTYTGPAWTIVRLEPKIQTEDLSRELAVRLMERDVDELERLRRIDELRAKEDADRRQSQERESAAQAAAQAAAAVAAGSAAVDPGAVKSGQLPPATPAQPNQDAAQVPAPKPAFKYPARPSSDPWWGMQYLYGSR